MKYLIPVMVLILLLSTSFVGLGNKIGENINYKENKVRIAEKFIENSKKSTQSLFKKNFWLTDNCPCCNGKNQNNFNILNIQGKLPGCGHYAYIGTEAYYPWDCWIYKVRLNDGNSTCICYGPSFNFFSSGTLTSDQRLLVVKYTDGTLYEIELDSCNVIEIGGGGAGLNGLTYDQTTGKVYGCSSTALYEIDPETGGQEYIGSFNIDTIMIEIVCDAEGVIYGWDVLCSGESHLYEIDKDTGEASVVGGMGIALCYAQDGDFCKNCDILYLVGYVNGIYYLIECDEDTGECVFLGALEGLGGFRHSQHK